MKAWLKALTAAGYWFLAWPAVALELPDSLRDWQGWVLDGQPDASCPRAQGSLERPVCTLYGRLRLDVGDDAADFSVAVTHFGESPVVLPGSDAHWPQEVRVNGALAPVLNADGQPVVRVSEGRFEITGRFFWSPRPEQLQIPQALPSVQLRVDGQSIEPVQRAGRSLWLGRAASSERQSDALQVQVYRRIDDGAPATVTTLLRLQVTGKAREEVFGPMLLPGLEPLRLSSDLRAELDPQGQLRVQVRPGSFELMLTARLLQPLVSLERPAPGNQWPATEIWSYAADPGLRISEAEADAVIDPVQADVPEPWRTLPAFVMEPGQSLRVAEISRGKTDQERNRLSLQRELWLRFDGSQWLGRDVLDGEMQRDWRLDLLAPLTLERASSAGEPLLITQNEGRRGVEWRERAVNLQASWSSEQPVLLPVSGWNQTVEHTDWSINLPPGWRLMAASGADRSPATWWGSWRLFDAFAVAFLSVLAFRMLGFVPGMLITGCLVFNYFEPEAPLLSLALVLFAVLAARALPSLKARMLFRVGFAGIALVCVLATIGFTLQQLTHVVYPQLERSSVGSQSAYRDRAMDAFSNVTPEMSPAAAAEMVDEALEPQRMAKSIEGDVQYQSNVPQALNAPSQRRLERYSKGSKLQAGNAEPDWVWAENRLSFSGPIRPDQQVRLRLLSPFWHGVWRLTGLALLFATLVVLARALHRPGAPASQATGVASGLTALAMVGISSVASANTQPSDERLAELQTRLTRPPLCAPACAHLAAASITVRGRELSIELEIHAAERVAVALPYAAQAFTVLSVRVDQQTLDGALNPNQEPETILERGVHRVNLDARMHAEQLALRFPLLPARVSVEAPGYEVSGVREQKLLSDTVELVQIAANDGDGESAAAAVDLKRIAPFVEVTREITFNLDWQVLTTVRRLAPAQGGFNVDVPLLTGERLLSDHVELKADAVIVPFGPGDETMQYSSQLDPVSALQLKAPDWSRHAERWQLTLSPIWRAEFGGVPSLQAGADSGLWQQSFAPLPGEILTITVQRAEQVPGDWLAIDQVQLRSQQGERLRSSTLELSLRSTQAGSFPLLLPAAAELGMISLNGQTLNLRSEQGQLRIPINAGTHALRIELREDTESLGRMQAPLIDLQRPSSNLRIELMPPASRWLWHVQGPTLGPVVLYWPSLVLILAITLFLIHRSWISLNPIAAVLMAIGFSTVAWPIWLVILLWLALAHWRLHGQMPTRYWQYNLVQMAFPAATVVMLLVIAGSLTAALLGRPDMQIVGNGSNAYQLQWFADHSSGPLPQVSAYSAPLWLYQLLMLAFALWLAFSVLQWLRLAWQGWHRGGRWHARPAPAEPLAPTAEAAESAGTPVTGD